MINLNNSYEMNNIDLFLNKFLEIRGISSSDGRPLYQYKCNDEEYGLVRDILKEYQGISFGRLQRVHRWGMLFSLFATEWWRRNYREGSWKWDPILSEIGASLNQIERSALMKQGLACWNRELIKGRTEDFRYLATIAAEGGLPMNLLKDQGNNLFSYFRFLLQHYHPERSTWNANELVRNREAIKYLPVSLRQEVVYHLCSELLIAVYGLKQQVPLELGDDQITDFLNSEKPNWKESLPLLLEDEQVESLMNNLVKVSVQSGKESGRNQLKVVRTLRLREGKTELYGRYQIPPFFTLADLKSQIEGFPAEEITFAVYQQQGDSITGLGRLERSGSGEKLNYSPDIKKSEYPIRSTEVILYIEDSHGTRYQWFPRGISIESDLPLVFVEDEEHKNVWKLIAAGRSKIEQKRFVLGIRKSWQFLTDGQKPFRKIESLSISLFYCFGHVRLKNESGDQILIKGGEEKEELESYELVGKTFNFQSKPKKCFIGTPKLRSLLDDIDGRSYHASKLSWRRNGEWVSANQFPPIGNVELGVLTDEEIVFSTKVAILPETFQYKIDGTNHRILLEMSPNPKVTLNATERLYEERDSGKIMIQCERKGSGKNRIPVRIYWPGAGGEITLSFPDPIKGGAFIDASDQVFTKSQTLSIHQLPGYRAISLNQERMENIILEGAFQAEGLSYEESRYTKFNTPLPRNGRQSEISLNKLKDKLQRMFEVSDDPDSKILLNLITDGSPDPNQKLELFRFDIQLHFRNEERSIFLQTADSSPFVNPEPEAVSLYAASLSDKEQPVITLRSSLKSNGFIHCWDFPEEAPREGNPWLIFGDVNGLPRIRPQLWKTNPGMKQEGISSLSVELKKNNLPSSFLELKEKLEPKQRKIVDPETVESLKKATWISNEQLRKRAIKNVLKKLGKCWEHEEWEQLDYYLSTFETLPFSTIDVLRNLYKVPKTLTLFLLKQESNEKKFRQIWSMANELPFMWELIPVDSWLSAFQVLADHLRLEHENEKHFFLDFKEIFIDFWAQVNARTSNFRFIETLLKVQYLKDPRASRELESYKLPMIREGHTKQIDDHWETLIKQKANDLWPTYNNQDFRNKISSQMEKFGTLFRSNTEHLAYRQTVMDAPVFAAICCCTGTPFSKIDAFQLKELREFDKNWFDNTYQVALASAYLLKTENL